MTRQQAVAQPEAKEPPRVKAFRLGLAQSVPCFPNNRASRDHLKQKNLRNLLVDFVNWRSRYVGTRPRTVTVETAASTDPRWTLLSSAIGTFLDKVRKGEDLTPHLSLQPHTRGFTPAALAPGASVEDRWSDKDFVLTAHGFHHFHLGTGPSDNGIVERTDDLIFAHVTRETFNVVAIFDHSVFDLTSAERHRLWVVHDHYIYRNAPPGTVMIGTSVSTSGHSTHVVLYANKCGRTIINVDPNLNNRAYVEELFQSAGRTMLGRPRFAWKFNHLDLGVAETKSATFFSILHGWN
jgi:hypothetical protein